MSTDEAQSRRSSAVLGAALVLLSLVQLFVLLSRMDAVRAQHRADVVLVREAPRARATLAAITVPALGEGRVVVCPAELTTTWPATVTASLRATRGSALTADEARLERDETRGKRCFSGRLRPARATTYELSVVLEGLAPSVAIVKTELFAGARITPVHALPVLFCVLGLVLLGRAMGTGREPLHADETSSALVDELPVDRLGAGIISIVAMLVGTLLAAMVGIALGQLLGWRTGIEWHGGFNALVMLTTHATLALLGLLFLGWPWHPGWREAVAFRPLDTRGGLRALGLATVLVALAVLTSHFIEDVSRSPMGRMTEHAAMRYALGFGALVAPVSEELFYRGVLLRALGGKNRWLGVALSSAVFVLAHAQQLRNAGIGLLPIGTLSVVNGILRVKSNSLTDPWLVHTIYNGVLVLSLFFG